MNIFRKLKIDKANLFIIVVFTLPFLKFFIEYNFFNLRFIDDTQGSYSYFQYIYNYFGQYFSIPIWIDFLDGGLPSSFIIQHELSIFSIFFIIIGNLFNINPYWAFILLILFFNLLFLYGLYINLKNLFSKVEIFIVVSVIHLASFDLLFHFHSLITVSYLPFSFYYINKYFHTFKLTRLKQLLLLNLCFFFFHVHYYNIITLIYFPILMFVVFYFLKIKKINSLLNINSIKKSLKLKNLLWSISFIGICLIFFLIIKYQLNEYNSSSFGRSGYQVQYESFIDFYNVPVKKILSWFFLETFLLLSLNPGPIGVSLIIFSIIYFAELKHNKIYIVALIMFFSAFYLSSSHSFYFLKEVIGKILFYLPLTDYVRGLHNVIFISKFFVLLIIAFSIKFLLDEKLNLKKNILFLILINIIYTEIFFSINYNSMDPRIWVPYILGINIFCIYVLFISNKNIFSFIIIILVSTMPYYIKSFTFDEYYTGKNYKKLDNINKNKNLYTDKFCLKKDDIKNIYKVYFDQNIIPLSKHNQFFLNTEFKPCNVILNQRLRGSKKEYDLKNNTSAASFLDAKTNFNKNILINGKNYSVKNHFLKNLSNDNTSIYLISSGSYNIKTNSKEINTTLSFNKHWKIRENQNMYILKDNQGLLKIDKTDSSFKDIILSYENKFIKIIIYVFILLSFLSYISLSLIILKKVKS